jgi:ribonuclease HII
MTLPDDYDTLSIEHDLQADGYKIIGGVDEAGRGPLAGPVVAACVIIPEGFKNYKDLKDSKTISPKIRARLKSQLEKEAFIGIGIASEIEIDQINILQATLLAMKRAVKSLKKSPDYLLIDGKFPIPSFNIPQTPLIKGESKSASIAAASIIAKETRDEIMAKMHEQYPQYNFKKNKGYPTLEHRQAIEKFGPCKIHRKTFKRVREYVTPEK